AGRRAGAGLDLRDFIATRGRPLERYRPPAGDQALDRTRTNRAQVDVPGQAGRPKVRAKIGLKETLAAEATVAAGDVPVRVVAARAVARAFGPVAAQGEIIAQASVGRRARTGRTAIAARG